MEVARKKSLAAMALALSVEDDEDVQISSFKRKRSCWMKTWMFQKGRGIQNHLYRELLRSLTPTSIVGFYAYRANSLRSCWRSWGQRLPEKTLPCAEAFSPATRLQVTSLPCNW
ncbi:hypothetical protein MTO96_031775 [Rhipicephalus appendiculatus]